MTRLRGRRRRAGALVLTVALGAAIVAGCGDDDEAEPAPTTVPSTVAPAAPSPDEPDPTAPGPTPSSEPAPSGCGAAVEPGTSSRSVTVDGEGRTYQLHVPTGYDPAAPTPLVVTFHGIGSSGAAQLAQTRWTDVADREGALVVAPDATGLLRGWDFFTPASTPGSDAAFVQALLDELDGLVCVDPARRFANGISNGSAVAFGLACAGGGAFAAYGGVAGALSATGCGARAPAPIVYFHGTEDPIVALDGGSSQVPLLDPALDALASWAALGGCDPSPVVEQLTAHVERRTWTGCAEGADVVAHLVAGGGHTWPGSPDRSQADVLGATTDEIDATEVMWAFFAAHPAG